MTALYPGMSDATTGTAQANARVSTIPKLSWPIDGAASAFARSSSSVELLLGEEAEHVDPLARDAVPCEQELHRERVGADQPQPGAGAAVDVGPRPQQHRHPLARVVTADEDDRVRRGSPGSAAGGISTPFGITSKSQPLNHAWAELRASFGDGDPVVDPVEQEPPERHARRASTRAAPAACQVATTGHRATASADTQIAGVIGSCRWRTSNRSSAKTRFSLKGTVGLRQMFGSEPFAGTITVRPTGITSGGGVVVTAVARVQRARERAWRVVPDHDPDVVAARAERLRLELGVLEHGAPERPRERHDDAHLHPGGA